MKNLFLICQLLLFCNIAAAQSEDIKEIRAYYYKLKTEMKETEEQSGDIESVRFYVMKIEENIHGKSMPAVGNYHGVTEKWYTSDDENYGTDGNLVYKKSTFEIAARNEFSEFVFNTKGKLIFCFIKTAGSEYRYYFKDEKLLAFKTTNEEHSDFYKKEDWKYLVERAKD